MKISLRFRAYEYQKQAIRWILDRRRAGLFLDMGLGKTVCALSAIKELLDTMEAEKVLVIAPLRVASTVWAQEAEKWDHTKDLKVVRVLGTEKQRRNALTADADIYVTNRENVSWLVRNYGAKWDFDTVIIDELSSFKNPSAQRFRQLKRVIGKTHRVIGMTGTPVPNGLMDLWSEIFLLDGGERLTKSITAYRELYFYPGRGNGVVVFNYLPKKNAAVMIRNRIQDLCIYMSKEEYLDMPEIVFRNVLVRLPLGAQAQYNRFEREALLKLDDVTITALNAGATITKLQQMANGQIYDQTEKGSYTELHKAKLEALEQLVEEANGSPVLVFVAFRADIDRIKSALSARGVHELVKPSDIDAWNAGGYPVAVAHPASIGHGLNLQEGGHIIVWYGLTWNLEHYQQATDRLYRQGQKETVSVFHIIAEDTVDEAIFAALQKKDAGQTALLNFFKARREQLEQQTEKRIKSA